MCREILHSQSSQYRTLVYLIYVPVCVWVCQSAQHTNNYPFIGLHTRYNSGSGATSVQCMCDACAYVRVHVCVCVAEGSFNSISNENICNHNKILQSIVVRHRVYTHRLRSVEIIKSNTSCRKDAPQCFRLYESGRYIEPVCFVVIRNQVIW